MTIIEHINKEISRLKSEIKIGKGSNRGHLPGQVLLSLEKRLKAFQAALVIIKEAYN